MTRKDYVKIAAAFAPHYRAAVEDGDRGAIIALSLTLNSLCDVFVQDNPRFDRGKFIAAVRGE